MLNTPKKKLCSMAAIVLLPSLLIGCASTDEQKNNAQASATTKLSKVEQVVAAKKAKANQSVAKSTNQAKNKMKKMGADKLLAMNADELKVAKVESKQKSVGWIKNGAYLQFNEVNFGKGKNSIVVEGASAAKGGNVEVRLGGVDGKLLATVAVPKTGSWYGWKKFDAKLSQKVKGKQQITFVFTGGNGFLFNVKSFAFNGGAKSIANNVTAKATELMSSKGQVLAITANEFKIAKAEKARGAVGYIKNGAHVKFNQVDFGSGKSSIEIGAATPTKGGNVEVRLGGPQGELIATVAIAKTGKWDNWQAFSANLNKKISGKKDVTLVFTGGKNFLFNLKSFELK